MRLPSEVIVRLRRLVRSTERERSHRRYLAAGGDAAFRYRYDLEPGATILDLGGYHGDWTLGMIERFGCHSYIFEPVQDYVAALNRLFAEEPSVVVCPFGLGARTRTETISIADDASSTYTRGERTEHVLVKDAAEWWRDAEPGRVAVAKINIEGGEYEVLPRLIECGLIADVDEIQVQFHDVVPDAVRRMDEILADLALTHEPTYQFRFVWENWRRRSA